MHKQTEHFLKLAYLAEKRANPQHAKEIRELFQDLETGLDDIGRSESPLWDLLAMALVALFPAIVLVFFG